MRVSTDDARYGLASCSAGASERGGRGGSRTPKAHTTAETAHTTAGNNSAVEMPWLSANRGITNAPKPTPSGVAVWRIPMTNPRWSGGNQPTTNRPLAELLLAAAIPPRNRNTPTANNDSTEAAANAAAAMSTEPRVSTMRSPTRSTTYPHAMSVSTRPKLGIDDSRPASARSSPRSLCSIGMRNAAPLMNTLALVVAVSAMTSIDQRRAVLIASADIAPYSHGYLIYLNMYLTLWDTPGTGAAAGPMIPATRLGQCALDVSPAPMGSPSSVSRVHPMI